MPAQLKFFDRIGDLIEGPADLLTTAREMLRDTHRITKASDASKIPEVQVRRHVVSVVLQAAQERLREPLTTMVGDHLTEVAEEHEMLEGPAPRPENDDGHWQADLMGALVASFEGSDFEAVLEPATLTEFVALYVGDDFAADLVGAVLAVPIADAEASLAKLRVSGADIDKLVLEIRTPRETVDVGALSAPLSETPHTAALIDMAGRYLKDGGSVAPVREALEYVLAGDPTLAETAIAMLDIFDDEEAQSLRDVSAFVSEGGAAPISIEHVIKCAQLTEKAPSAEIDLHDTGLDKSLPDVPPEAAPAATRRKRARAVSGLESDRTRAACAAIQALCDHSAATETAVADMLGLSRATMLNYRHGHARLDPTPIQAEVLRAALANHGHPLNDALDNLNLALAE